MENKNHVMMMLIISLGLLIFRFLIKGRKDLFFYAIAFYFFFAFGPVVNYLSGLPIYFGTPHEYIPKAATIFTIAIGTMVLCSYIFGVKTTPNFDNIDYNYRLLTPIYTVFIIYSIGQGAYVFLGTLGGSKIDKINYLNPKIHYNYLLIQIYLCSFYFLVKEKVKNKLFWANFVSYIGYCIICGERDFIFILTSIALHILLYRKLSKRKRALILSSLVSFVFLGTAIFLIRDKHQDSSNVLSSVLNQGSLLFINSYTAKLLSESYDFFNGFTYFNSLQNLLPSWIHVTDFNTLDWFKNNYAPKSNSGYGFGLDAEGYMNFGYYGVVATFFFITNVQRFIIRNVSKADFFKYYSVFFLSFVMYTFRNDSLAFFKGNLYAIIFYFVIMIPSNMFFKKEDPINESDSNSRI